MSRRRREGIRAHTEQPRKVPKNQRNLLSVLHPDPDFEYQRPRTRADCMKMPRPCPFVACRHHLYLDTVEGRTSIKFNFPDKEPWELLHTCSLDLTDRGVLTLDDVGLYMNLTRERVRQVEEVILNRLGVDHDYIKTVISGLGHLKTERYSQDPRGYNEVEMKVLEAAARIAEIERRIDELRLERTALIKHLDTLAKTKPTILAEEGQEKPPAKPTDPPPKKRRGIPAEAISDAQEWILAILHGGELVPTRQLSSTIPEHVHGDQDPKKLVQKAMQDLAQRGLIENGGPGRSRSWRLTPQ